MSKAMMLVGIIILAILTFGAINLISSYTTGNELDYYLIKDTTEAAMLDAVDANYYKITGTLRMDKEKFLDSFMRRFANNVANNRDYEVKFYDIHEIPPKVSVQVDSDTVATFDGEGFNITNRVDGIIESSTVIPPDAIYVTDSNGNYVPLTDQNGDYVTSKNAEEKGGEYAQYKDEYDDIER